MKEETREEFFKRLEKNMKNYEDDLRKQGKTEEEVRWLSASRRAIYLANHKYGREPKTYVKPEQKWYETGIFTAFLIVAAIAIIIFICWLIGEYIPIEFSIVLILIIIVSSIFMAWYFKKKRGK